MSHTGSEPTAPGANDRDQGQPATSPATGSSGDSAARRRPRRRWFLWAALLGLVVVAAMEHRREVARWYVAAAIEQELDGDVAGAIQTLSEATEWDSGVDLLTQRAELKLEADDLEGALADANLAIETNPNFLGGYAIRSRIQQRMGNHREAVDDWTKLIERLGSDGVGQDSTVQGIRQYRTKDPPRTVWGRPPFVNVQNGRAYARAVGELEIDEGLAEIQQVIENSGRWPAYLDTRGFLRYHAGQNEEALEDLNEAVKEVEAQYAEWEKHLQPSSADQREPDDPTQYLDPRRLERALKSLAETVAVLRYHRSLVYDKLNDPDQAEADRQRVIELGFKPDPSLY